jgi:hypothetical protein
MEIRASGKSVESCSISCSTAHRAESSRSSWAFGLQNVIRHPPRPGPRLQMAGQLSEWVSPHKVGDTANPVWLGIPFLEEQRAFPKSVSPQNPRLVEFVYQSSAHRRPLSGETHSSRRGGIRARRAWIRPHALRWGTGKPRSEREG